MTTLLNSRGEDPPWLSLALVGGRFAALHGVYFLWEDRYPHLTPAPRWVNVARSLHLNEEVTLIGATRVCPRGVYVCMEIAAFRITIRHQQ